MYQRELAFTHSNWLYLELLNVAWPEGRGNRETKAPIRYFGKFFYNDGRCSVKVPPGKLRVEVWKGFEYQPQTRIVALAAGERKPLELALRRSISSTDLNYWGGDLHLHFDRVSREDERVLFDLLEAEDIQYALNLTWNNDTTTYRGTMDALSNPQRAMGERSIGTRGDYSILSEQEYRGNVYGHMLFAMLDHLVLPGAVHNINDWPVYGEVAKEIQAQNGYAFHAHGGYAQEVYADVVQGRVDGVELLQFGKYRGIQLEGWYHILNTGLRLPAYGASDFDACRKLGDCRTYGYHKGRPTMRQWLDAVAQGRSFVTSGPILLVEVDGHLPGDTIQRTGDGPYEVRIALQARSNVAPITNVDIIVNGEVVQELNLPRDEQPSQWFRHEQTLPLNRPSWIAARAYSRSPTGTPDAESHTNPIFVNIDGNAPYHEADVDWLIAELDKQITFHEQRVFDKQHLAIRFFERSKELLEGTRRQGQRRASEVPTRTSAADSATESASALQEFLETIPPRTPDEALAEMRTVDGLRLDLFAAEPMVTDPVVAAFDEHRQLFVGELVDYPYKPSEGGLPLGRVRILVDEDNDGHADQAHVFADRLLWPTGIAPWRGGVFVASAPDIWYLKDTDGDYRADVRQKVFTGFGTQNQQGMLNNLVLGIDGKIHGSTSSNGGDVRRVNPSDAQPVNLNGQAFRFDPDTFALEAILGNAQFGNTFDDLGHRFTCSESSPIVQVMVPPGYFQSNPHLRFSGTTREISVDGIDVFRISPVEPWRTIRSQRRVASRWLDAANPAVSHTNITSAAGLTCYRGDAFPVEMRGNMFVGCAQTHLVHRRRLEREGIQLHAHRVDEQQEINRSPDTWFRPVNFVNAPDGTLYVLDLYRETIESVHIPRDVAELLDLRNGRGYGRIYRLAPSDFKRPERPRLASATTAQLVAFLESENGWRRDTAQRLLNERQNQAAVRPLRELFSMSAADTTRLHAIYCLHQLGSLGPDILKSALVDESASVRRHTLRLAEEHWEGDVRLLDACLRLADDSDQEVRRQLALSLAASSEGRRLDAIQRLARRDGGDRWMRSAVLSAVPVDSAELFSRLAVDEGFLGQDHGLSFLIELSGQIGRRADAGEVDAFLEVLVTSDYFQESLDCQRHVLLALAKPLRRSGHCILESASTSSVAEMVYEQLNWAQRAAASDDSTAAVRQQAYVMLGFGQFNEAEGAFRAGISADADPSVQLAAVSALLELDDATIPTLLIEQWSGLAPDAARETIRVLVSRDDATNQLLNAIESEVLPPTCLSASDRSTLREHPSEAIRQRAESILGVVSPRADVLATYQAALAASGDLANGKRMYDEHCATCHKYGERGYDVGPNLAVIDYHTGETLLVHILDPNRDVNPKYQQYVVADQSGLLHVGMIAAQSAGSIILRQEEGKEVEVPSVNVESLQNRGSL